MKYNKRTHVKTTYGWLNKEVKEDWLLPYNDMVTGNLSMRAFSKELGIQYNTFKKYLLKFDLSPLSKEESHRRRTLQLKQNNLEKYGVESTFQLEEVREKSKASLRRVNKEGANRKRKQTNLEKYGVENPLQCKEIRDKVKETNLKKYGLESYLQTEKVRGILKEKAFNSNKDIRDKIKKTNLEKYGVEHPLQCKEIKDKITRTSLEKYGVKNPSQSDIVKNKIKETNLGKYGVVSTLQLTKVKEKIKETNLKKYGVEKIGNSNIVREKVLNTRYRVTVDKIEGTLKNLGYKLNESFTSVFIRDSNLLKWKKYEFEHLECGYVFKRSLNKLENILCPNCFPVGSVKEVYYRDYIKTLISYIETNDRSKLKCSELDIFIPELNIAFEYNGSYWHSSINKEKNYHKDKTEKCLEKGIKLFHIWESDSKIIVKSLIKSKLNKIEKKCYARKLQVKEVSTKERREFFNSNHLHGDVSAKFSLGLYTEGNELLQCISFRKHKEGIEIARLATKLNTTVVGGFSKLLKFSFGVLKKEGYNKIITYCNRDWTPDYKDSVYYKNGFSFVKDSGPQLRYYNSKLNIVENREKYQKHKLKKLFPDIYDDSLTADRILSEKGIYPIYNSGNWKFSLRIL